MSFKKNFFFFFIILIELFLHDKERGEKIMHSLNSNEEKEKGKELLANHTMNNNYMDNLDLNRL